MKNDAKGGKPMSPKQEKLAALAGNKKKLTQADVIAGAKMKESSKPKTYSKPTMGTPKRGKKK